MNEKDVYFKPGDSCLLRGINRGNVCNAWTTTVVNDSAQETVLVLQPSAECAFPSGYWRRRMHHDFSQGSRWVETGQPGFEMKPFIWHTNRVLMILHAEKYYATYLFWQHETNEFIGYYINFQQPFSRVATGFDTLDLDIDIVINLDGTWYWKDEEEYQMGIREGGITPEWVKGIENSYEEVFAMIEHKTYPMDDSWLNWKPDPLWKPGKLVEGWNIVKNE